MSDDQKLSALTRSLMLGVSVGAIGLTQVGCAPQAAPAYGPAAERSVTFALPAGEEADLCRRALETQSAADAEAFLTRYPQSRCVGPLLSALPAPTLSALTPAAVVGVPPAVLQGLPPRVRSHLPGDQRVAAPGQRPLPEPDRGY